MRQLIFGILIISLVFTTCKKEPPMVVDPEPEWVPDSCDISIPDLISIWGVSFGPIFPYYLYPCYNPNNENEIAFREVWLETDTIVNDTVFQLARTGLVKYNLLTQEKQLLYEGPVGPRPRWSRKDWILLNLPDLKIHKIKSNGDSLTQLTFEGECRGPEWDKYGDRFVYQLYGPDGEFSVYCDENGNELFRHEWGAISPSWQHDSLLTQVSAHALTVWSPERHNFETIHESGVGLAGFAEWLDDENIIWTNFKGIFVSNRISKETTKVRETCIGDFFYQPTYNAISDRVIFIRWDRTITDIDLALGTSTYHLYMMNPDGTELKKIEVPEW